MPQNYLNKKVPCDCEQGKPHNRTRGDATSVRGQSPEERYHEFLLISPEQKIWFSPPEPFLRQALSGYRYYVLIAGGDAPAADVKPRKQVKISG